MPVFPSLPLLKVKERIMMAQTQLRTPERAAGKEAMRIVETTRPWNQRFVVGENDNLDKDKSCRLMDRLGIRHPTRMASRSRHVYPSVHPSVCAALGKFPSRGVKAGDKRVCTK